MMDMVVLKVTCKNLFYFDQESLDIDFIAEKRIYSDDTEENLVSKLVNSVCKLNTMAFIGINAAGKTSTMNVLSSVLKIYLGNASLSYDMPLAKYFNNSLEIETYYYHKKSGYIYKIWSKIKKNDSDKLLYFEDEILYERKAFAQETRGSIFVFGEENIRLDRKTVDNPFLKQEDSIFSSLMNRSGHPTWAVIDMCDVSFNFLTAFTPNMIMDFVQYLDPSIVKFELLDEGKDDGRFKIRFKDAPEDILVERLELNSYLSSGTIKGISFLTNMIAAFLHGGYLLMDEIENHLNKAIVTNILRMFNSDLNKNAATLLFSTHYSEILDVIDRSDSIYVLNKKENISINKFSRVAGQYDRTDKKKSDVILSGILDTAPKYNAYMNLKKAFRQRLEGGVSDD